MKRFFLPLFALAMFLFISCSEDPVTPEPDNRFYVEPLFNVRTPSLRITELDEEALKKLDKILKDKQMAVPYWEYPEDIYYFLPQGEYTIVGFTGKYKLWKDDYGSWEDKVLFGANGNPPFAYFDYETETPFYGFAHRGNEAFMLVVAKK